MANRPHSWAITSQVSWDELISWIELLKVSNLPGAWLGTATRHDGEIRQKCRTLRNATNRIEKNLRRQESGSILEPFVFKTLLNASLEKFCVKMLGRLSTHLAGVWAASRVRQFVPLCAEHNERVISRVQRRATLRTGAAPSHPARLSEFLAAKNFTTRWTTVSICPLLHS